MKTLRILTAIAALNIASQASAIRILGDDLTNGTYSAARHDRYYVGPDKAFIGAPLNLSGVSHAEVTYGAYGTWATMISDTYFISANHSHPSANPSNPGRVTFHREDNPASDYWQADVTGGFRIGTSDLWVGQLASAPPSWVERYPLIKRPDSFNYLGLPQVQKDLFIAGLRHAPNAAVSQPPDPTNGIPNVMRVGKNEIDYFYLTSNGAGNNGFSFSISPSGMGFSDDEAITLSGDSGAPSFIMTPSGVAVLAGTHSIGGADSSISSYVSDIVSSVPEPVQVLTDLPGDINADFRVNSDDYNVIALNYGASNATYSQGDINGDGNVNSSDYNWFALNFQKSLSSPADFNGDWKVDRQDFYEIANHWSQAVPQGTLGDVDKNGVVNAQDVNELNKTWYFYYPHSSLPAPLVILPGDYNEDGLVGQSDAEMLYANFDENVAEGNVYDLDADGDVDFDDLFYLGTLYRTAGIADLDGDGKVFVGDLQLLLSNWETSGAGLADGDFNGDGVVDNEDFTIMASYWGLGMIPGSIISDQLIPEPPGTALVPAMLTGLAMFRRRNGGRIC